MRRKRNASGLLLIFLAAASSLFAQNDFRKESKSIDALLLQKDLATAIREAESAPARDVRALLRRLNLYQRVVNNAKIAATVRQITEAPDFEKNRYAVHEYVKSAVKDEFFKDAETLRIYLQRIYFDDIYGKYIEVCQSNRNVCDVIEFDEWLARKASEAREKGEFNSFAHEDWTSRRIHWREQFGLDNAEIFAQFAAAVRENPSDLETALRFLKFSRTSAEIAWLAETFSSKRAYDYYELGERLSNSGGVFYDQEENEVRESRQIAARLLQKSLALPYDEQDKISIDSRRFRYTSVAPRIGNYEKQLRYWTKSRLAEVYKNSGEPQKAQPIVEELAAFDTSDIMPENVGHLAGAVQSASGARTVEAKILAEEASRRDSYEYWRKRISYYSGREEPESVFDAYLQSFAAVPFSLDDENSYKRRLTYVSWFADFADSEFGYYANAESEELSDREKRKKILWQEAENFLRAEFEKTKSNLHYSHELASIIKRNHFNKLLDEIFSRHPEFLIGYFKIKALNSADVLLVHFLQNEKVSKAQKEAVMSQIQKIAESSDAESAWAICEVVIGGGGEAARIYAARLVPVLLKNLEKTEKRLNSAGEDTDEKYDSENLRNKYLENLFSAYLAANDWKSAEKLVLTKYQSSINYSLWRLADSAAKNGANADAARLWKLRANLNRRNLDNLEYLARNAEIKTALREFYRQMKAKEPFSPIPDIALRKLAQ
jgi:hypothetical protein